MPANSAGDALIQSSNNSLPAGHGRGSSSNTSAPFAQEGTTLASLGLKASNDDIATEARGFHTNNVLGEYISARSLRSMGSGLPPTPPSQNGEFDEPLMSPAMLSEVYPDALSSPRMQVSTPVQLTGPPTPDTTPPSTRDRLRVPSKGLYHFPSLSQADSFVTARETLPSRSSNRSQSYQSVTPGEPSLQSSRLHFSSTPDNTDAKKPDDKRDPTTPPRKEVSQYVETSPSPRSRTSYQSSTGDLTNNVHSMKKPESTRMNGHLTPEAAHTSAHSRNSSIISTNKSDVSPGRKPRHRRRPDGHSSSDHSKDSLQQQEDHNPNSSHDALYAHLRDEKSKRLSGHSYTSTVVEAIVYTSPQKPHRALRHAGKNLALRGDGDDLQQARRNFSDMTETHEHRLRHRKSPLPGRAFGMGHLHDADEKPRAVSTPEALRKQSSNTLAPSQESSPKIVVRTLSKPAKRLTPPDWPLRITNDSSARSEQSEDAKSVNSVRQKGIRPGRPVELTDDEDEPVERDDSSPDMHFPRMGWRRGIVDDELLSPPLKPPTSFSMPRTRNDSLDVDESKLLPFRSHSGSDAGVNRGSTDGSRRGSLDPRMDHAHARHHSSAHTPMSEHSAWSDRTHTAEVNQARAISIFPHHNESLLLVQHPKSTPNRPLPLPSLAEPPSPTTSIPKFEAFLDTGTPAASTPSLTQHHSPLTNPRTAPLPPVIQFIPATPLSEADRQLTSSPGMDSPFSMNSTAPLPVRRASLRERARAQSVALVDAILLRGNSVRSTRRRRRNTVAEERPGYLDPFWRPRGFWEGFDSDDEEEGEGGYEPLPRGGDERDVGVGEEKEGAGMGKGEGDKGVGVWPRKMSVRRSRARMGNGNGNGNGFGVAGGRKRGLSLPLSLPLPLRLGGGRSWVPGQEGTVALGVRKRRSEKALRTGTVLARGKFGVVGTKVRGLREWSGRVREGREERAREKRRERIRGSIGEMWVQEGR
ncbi:hypothetical protein KVT40_004807 [Elsinoe batatas]|uniref:Uncharacterized protein n=1 Tax=Elsinoe batatas TaxID=2601811 RepID=A0A8K0L2M5_9PEZI|nr:hypothetical protein KVT40_004807 [Elsinoe batatas]